MPNQILYPLSFIDLGSWSDESFVLGGIADGYGAFNTGPGYLSLRDFAGRDLIPGNATPIGFEIELWGRTNGPLLVNDTFTDTPPKWLHDHDGELNADWRRPFTGADPSYQGINSKGRTYYGAQNDSGSTTNGAEHFLTQYVPPSADYAVEARIFAASDGGNGEVAEVYARAATPYTFYFLAYQEGTNTWQIGISNGFGTRTVLQSYVGDTIAPGTSKLCRLECRGTSIKGFIEGIERLSVVNGTITLAGYPGLRLDIGSGRPSENSVITTALYDLGTAQTVTRFRKKAGTVNTNSYPVTSYIEASSDGVNWVNAYTGLPIVVGIPFCVFGWDAEFDSTFVTTTAYRYWRVVCLDTDTDPPSCPPDCRISDFRLYVAGNLVIPDQISIIARGASRSGTTPHNWSEATNTLNFSDGSPGNTSTWIGGTGSSGTPISDLGLQFDSFRVLRLLPSTINVYLSANGTTPVGSPKTLLLTADSTYRLIGSPQDLWNGGWTIGDIKGQNFAILLERGEMLAEAWIDTARIIIYYASNGGSLMALREHVRQQITIGREVGVNAVQTLTIGGTPTGGTFTLSFNGVTTAGIAYNAAAAAVQSALEAISSIGAGHVLCAGGALPGAAVTITFQGDLGGMPQNLITVNIAGLTGGTPTGSIANTTTGVRAVGNPATPSIRLRHSRIQPQPAPEFMDHRPAGEKLINHQIVLKESSEGPIEGIPTYDEMGWLLQSLIARPNSSVLASGANRHVFAMDNRIRDGISSYTAEYGDPSSRTHRVNAMIVNALNMNFRQDGIDLGGSIIAQLLQDGVTPSLGAATVQTITQSGSGTFRLRLRGQETADITAGVSLTAATVETALRALAFVNSSTALTVSGSAGGPFTVTFANTAGQPFQGNPQPLLESRTISGTPTVTIAMTTRGGFVDYPGQIILPRHMEVFLSPTLANLGSSKLLDVFATGFSMGNRAIPVYNLDRSSTSWFAYAEPSNIDIQSSMIIQAQSVAMQFLSQARSDTILYLRLLATGPLIGTTAFPHRLQIDLPVKVSGFGPFSENQDIYAFEYQFTGAQDDGTNTNLVVTLDNGVTNYN